MPNSVLPVKKTKPKTPFLSLPEFLIWKRRPGQCSAGMLALQQGGGRSPDHGVCPVNGVRRPQWLISNYEQKDTEYDLEGDVLDCPAPGELCLVPQTMGFSFRAAFLPKPPLSLAYSLASSPHIH